VGEPTDPNKPKREEEARQAAVLGAAAGAAAAHAEARERAAEQARQAGNWGGPNIDLSGAGELLEAGAEVAGTAEVGAEVLSGAFEALSSGGEVLGGVLEGLGGCASGCSTMIALAVLLASAGAVLAASLW
jgi:hypothetical protein